MFIRLSVLSVEHVQRPGCYFYIFFLILFLLLFFSNLTDPNLELDLNQVELFEWSCPLQQPALFISNDFFFNIRSDVKSFHSNRSSPILMSLFHPAKYHLFVQDYSFHFILKGDVNSKLMMLVI